MSKPSDIAWQNFGSFRQHVQQALTRSLPGMEGHRIMAPRLDMPREKLRPTGDNYRLGGVMALFYPRGHTPHIVLIQRHVYNGAHSGQISFPGGRYERGDANMQMTALRETREEVGVNSEDIEVIGELSELFIPASNYVVHPYVGLLDYEPAFKREAKEVEEILEVPFDHFYKSDHLKSKAMKLSSGPEVEVPFFDVDNRVLWGATAMILGELLLLTGWEPPNA